MCDSKKIDTVTAALKLRFNRDADPAQPSAEWRRRLDARLAEIRPERDGGSPFVHYEKQIWRAGWISFAASMAALLLFCLLNLQSLRQSAVDEALRHLYGNIIVENEL